jgi:hypothetical protein
MASYGDERSGPAPGAAPEGDASLVITRLGGLLPTLRPKRTILLRALSKLERDLVQELFSNPAHGGAEDRRPDATSYKFELKGHAVTIAGSKVPELLSKLLP